MIIHKEILSISTNFLGNRQIFISCRWNQFENHPNDLKVDLIPGCK